MDFLSGKTYYLMKAQVENIVYNCEKEPNTELSDDCEI